MEEKHRILVVDDDPAVCQWLQEVLEEAGFAVSTAEHGRAMQARMAEQPYALLILDLKLKGEDGLTVARELRRQSAIPIIMISGQGDETDRVLGLELAAHDGAEEQGGEQQRVDQLLGRFPDGALQRRPAAQREAQRDEQEIRQQQEEVGHAPSVPVAGPRLGSATQAPPRGSPDRP